MKVLYALQCTGNGHIARAQEILPILKKYAEVDILTSGHQSQMEIPQHPKFSFQGISLMYNSRGELSYWKTARQNNFLQAVKDIGKIPVENYDLILNDFEPLSAWACKRKKLSNIIGISHQASLLFPESPKPLKKNILGEFVLKNYAPTSKKIGFHFEPYHPEIYKPIIRSSIRQLTPTNKGFYITYMPSFSDQFLIENLSETHVDWKIFSKSAKKKYTVENLEIYTIDQTHYLEAFQNCEGILCNGGFETPSEALFLKKKVYVIPIKNQYEQECNAIALEKLGVNTSCEFNTRKIQEWIDADNRVELDFPDQTEELIQKILGIKYEF